MDKTNDTKKQKNLTIRLDDELESALKERVAYLQKQTPYTKVTRTMAVRHALTHTGYKRHNKKKDEEE